MVKCPYSKYCIHADEARCSLGRNCLLKRKVK